MGYKETLDAIREKYPEYPKDKNELELEIDKFKEHVNNLTYERKLILFKVINETIDASE